MKSKKSSAKDVVVVALAGWPALLKTLGRMTEADLERALQIEKEGKKRKQFLRRIAMRLNKLRGKALLKSALE